MSELIQRLEAFLDSTEGKEAIEKYWNDINSKKKIFQNQLKRFHEHYAHRFDELIAKVITKYSSEKYKDCWYSRSIEPPEPLLSFLFAYAQKYGRKATKKEFSIHGNEFTAGLYFCNDYFFNLMHGQGSVIKVTKAHC